MSDLNDIDILNATDEDLRDLIDRARYELNQRRHVEEDVIGLIESAYVEPPKVTKIQVTHLPVEPPKVTNLKIKKETKK